MDTEGCVGQNDVLLGWQGTIFEYTVEDGSSLFLGSTANKLLGLGNLEAKVGGLEDALVLLGLSRHLSTHSLQAH